MDFDFRYNVVLCVAQKTFFKRVPLSYPMTCYEIDYVFSKDAAGHTNFTSGSIQPRVQQRLCHKMKFFWFIRFLFFLWWLFNINHRIL